MLLVFLLTHISRCEILTIEGSKIAYFPLISYAYILYKNTESSIAPNGIQYDEFVYTQRNRFVIILPVTSNKSAGKARKINSSIILKFFILHRKSMSRNATT